MAPASVPTGTSVSSQPRSVVVDPSGKYVYVTNFGDDNVSQYKIGADGRAHRSTATVAPESGRFV